MKIIYYSTAYFASHGGSTHSKSFVESAQKNVDVEELIVFPPKEIIRKPHVLSTGGKNTLTGLMKRSSIAAIFRFFRRSNFYLDIIVKEIERLKPDAILIRLDSNFTQITKLKEKFPALIVATEINASPFDEAFKEIGCRFFFQWLERKHLTQADLNFFVSDTLRKKIMRRAIHDHRDFVLPNGVDPSLFTPSSDKTSSKRKLGLPVGKKIIGYVGTLDVTKRLDVLLMAYSILHKTRDDVYFVIVGNGPEFITIKEQLVKNDLQDVALLTGNVAHKEVPAYLQAFDIAVHHAANDYMCPLKLFEYFASGLPVVGPDTAAVREIFENEKHLLLCQPESTSIVENLNYYLDDLFRANNMAQQGLAWVKTRYTWQINADTVINGIKSSKQP